MIAAVLIGLVAMVMTALGMHLGKQVGKLPKFSLVSELLAGVVLILIGFHMLYDAGVFDALLLSGQLS